jgi:uncharacterized protein
MVRRTQYLDSIRPFIRKPLIKVITGIRRCGKSTLMLQIIDELKDMGVAESHILYINKELYEFDQIQTYHHLLEHIRSLTPPGRDIMYVFVDEVQEISGWEKGITSLLAERRFDLYLSGSNAHMFSSELSTLLSGRYVEFRMNTLNFREYCQITSAHQPYGSNKEAFFSFLKYGGFPGIHSLTHDDTVIRQYLHGVYSTILLKDIVLRNSIRDVALLEKLTEYLIDNCGNITSAKSLSDYTKAQFRKTSAETVQNYIQYVCNAFLLLQVKRFDIKGKRLLETFEKYYTGDTGLRFATLGYQPEALPGLLENVVLLELISRGNQITIGKHYEKEIDFIATHGSERIYIQVCTTLNDPKTVDREYSGLEAIDNHFPKLVLSLDEGFETSRKGIKWMNLIDFIADEDTLL